MHPFIQDRLAEIKARIGRQRRCLEIGSRDINGSARIHFQDASQYVGIDLVAGPGVDRVLNAHELPQHFRRASFDCVICCEVLEHDRFFWKTLEGIDHVLRVGGYLILSVPGPVLPYHYPPDYYRFYESAFTDTFFIGYDLQYSAKCFAEGQQQPKSEHASLIAYGQKRAPGVRAWV